MKFILQKASVWLGLRKTPSYTTGYQALIDDHKFKANHWKMKYQAARKASLHYRRMFARVQRINKGHMLKLSMV